jgi:quinol monooxygenase YgiN
MGAYLGSKPIDGKRGDMKVIIAKAKVQEGKESEFEKVALELSRQVEANESGNKLYKLCKSAEGEYFFIELYESAEAMAEHGAASHLKEAGPRFAGLMAGRPELTVLDVVGE